MQGLVGVVLLLLTAWLLSENRRSVPVRTLCVGLVLHVTLALLLLFLPASRDLFLTLNTAVTALQDATHAGTTFVFGWLGGGDPPFLEQPGASSFVLAFQALPLVLVVSALSALLYHWRVLPAVVGAFAWALRRTLGLGGTAGVATAANVFVGMVEAALLVRPYITGASRSDLFVIMTTGMATIAGTVLALYAGFLQGVMAAPVGYLLTASVLNAVSAIVIARLMVPPDPGRAISGPVRMEALYGRAMEAITRGTADGLRLLLNITAMLLVLVAFVALVNMALSLLPLIGGEPVTLQRLLGYAMAPVAWAIGVPWTESGAAGSLIGTKVVLNELIAYVELSRLPEEALSPHSRLILTYALCGFANFGSLGIMLGGLTTMAPERREDILSLGLRAVAGGTLATLFTGAMIGVLVGTIG